MKDDMNLKDKILKPTVNNWKTFLIKLKSNYKTLMHWLLESTTEDIWLEYHEDDLFKKLLKLQWKTKSKSVSKNFNSISIIYFSHPKIKSIYMSDLNNNKL